MTDGLFVTTRIWRFREGIVFSRVSLSTGRGRTSSKHWEPIPWGMTHSSPPKTSWDRVLPRSSWIIELGSVDGMSNGRPSCFFRGWKTNFGLIVRAIPLQVWNICKLSFVFNCNYDKWSAKNLGTEIYRTRHTWPGSNWSPRITNPNWLGNPFCCWVWNWWNR